MRFVYAFTTVNIEDFIGYAELAPAFNMIKKLIKVGNLLIQFGLRHSFLFAKQPKIPVHVLQIEVVI